MRGIKNYDNLTKEDLIFSLLKSESNPIERNYMKYLNNGTNDEIKSKINDIRLILRNNLRKKKYLEKRNNLSDNEKGKICDDLVKLANTLDEKVKHKHSDRDDLDYFEIRELENLFTNDDYNGDNYYKPVLIRSSFKNNYEYYEIRGDKDKELSIKQYLYVVMPGLADLINKSKNDRVECKNQLNMGVNFISTNGKEKFVLFMCGVIMKKLYQVMKHLKVLLSLLNLF